MTRFDPLRSRSAERGFRPAVWAGLPLAQVQVAATGAARRWLARMADQGQPQGGVAVQRIEVPTVPADRIAFLRDWMARNRMRASLGLGSLVLVLPMAAAAATPGQTPVSQVEGIAGVEVQADGSLRLTMDDGRVLQIPAEAVVVGPDGEITISTATVEALGAGTEAVAGASMGAGAGALGLLALGAAAGGGGGGGGSGGGGTGGGGGGTSGPTTGFVIDGYVAGATVFRDTNGNRLPDAGEASTLSLSDGSFDLSVLTGTGALVSFGGIDISTGLEFRGTLTAPEGSTVVTPLTTLVQAVIVAAQAEGSTLTAGQAAAQVATSLGLTGTDLLNDDPIAGNDLPAIKAAVQVANIIALVEAAEGDGALAVSALAAALGNQTDVLGDAGSLSAVLAASGIESGQAADAAEALAASNTLIADAADVSVVETIQIVVQDTVADAVREDRQVAATDFDAAIDNVAPLTPEVSLRPTTPINASEAANGIEIAGTGRPGTTVTVNFGGAVKTDSVDEDGDWSVTYAAQDLPQGAATLTVSAGPTSVLQTFGSILVDTLAPAAPTIDTVATDNAVNASEAAAGVVIAGSAEAGATVTVRLGDTQKQATANEGRWTVTYESGELPLDGLATVTATARDALGNESVATGRAITVDTVAPEAPVINAVTGDDTVNAAEVQGGLVVSGTAAAGLAVILSLGSATQQSDATEAGTWTVTFPANQLPPDGSATVTAIARDGAGNSSPAERSFDLDRTAPAAPTLDAVAADDRVNQSEASEGLTLAGSAEVATTVTVLLDGVSKVTTVNDAGRWSVTYDNPELPADGEVTVTVTARDALGNESVATQRAITFDSVAPEAPVINAVTGDDRVNAAEVQGGLVVSGTAAAGLAVIVSLGGSSQLGVASASGAWSVTFPANQLPPEGEATVTALARDDAGNESAGTSRTFSLDITPPDAPIINAVTGDNLITVDEAAEGISVSGTAEVGADVTVTLGSIERPVVATDGSWSVSLASNDLPQDGTYPVTVVATDAAGNAGAAAVVDLVIDRSPLPAVLTQFSLESARDLIEEGAINGDLISGTETKVELRSLDGRIDVTLHGTGFTYGSFGEGTELVGGMITGVSVLLDGEPAATLTGISADVAAVNRALDAENAVAVLDAVLAGTGGLRVIGSAADNDLNGSFLDDVIIGGGGSDFFIGSAGDDRYEGDGNGQLSYNEAGAAVTVNLAAGTTLKADGTDTFTGIDAVRGSAFDDTLLGDGADNSFRGLAGNDTIDGGAGNDRVRYDRDVRFGGDAGVFVNLSDVQAENASGILAAGTARDGFGDIDRLISIEDVDGSNFDDEVVGSIADNVIRTLGGDDDIIGSDGNDTIDGGEGNDQLIYANLSGPIIANLVTGIVTKGDAEDRISGIEAIRGTALDDQITGSANDESFHGLAGDDIIIGGGGQDEMRYDREVNFGGVQGVSVNLATGTATDSFGNTDTLSGIIAVRGTMQDDTIIGDANDNRFAGYAGTDHIEGGDGWDMIRYDREGGPGGVTVDLDQGTATDSFGDTDFLTGIEEVRGTAFDDELRGDSHDNALRGNEGGDDIHGSAGNDFLSGGEGIDQLIYASLNGPIIADLAAGTVEKTDGVDYVDGFELFRGTAFDDEITGGEIGESLMGLRGADTIDGGGGFDWVRYDRDDRSGGTQGVDVNLASGEATDGFGDSDTLSNIEGARGGIYADTLTGSGDDNAFTGFKGADRINGGAGRDTVVYVPEQDDGGDRGVVVDLAAGRATDTFGDTDTLISIEQVIGTTLDDTLRGDAGDNLLDGLSGNDTFDGAGGDDEIWLGDGKDTVFLYARTTDSVSDLRGPGGFDTIVGFSAGMPDDGQADTLVIVPPMGSQGAALNVMVAAVAEFSEASLGNALAGQSLSSGINLLYVTDGTDALLAGVLDTDAGPELYAIAEIEGIGTLEALQATQFQTGQLDDLASPMSPV